MIYFRPCSCPRLLSHASRADSEPILSNKNDVNYRTDLAVYAEALSSTGNPIVEGSAEQRQWTYLECRRILLARACPTYPCRSWRSSCTTSGALSQRLGSKEKSVRSMKEQKRFEFVDIFSCQMYANLEMRRNSYAAS